MENKRVVFNVGGTRFETKSETILGVALEFGLLNMLVVRHLEKEASSSSSSEHEIFIDRDPVFFRWMLYFYRTGGRILASHEDVGVGKRIWNEEIQFYGIVPIEVEEKKEKTKRQIIEKRLIVTRKRFKRKKQTRVDALHDKCAVFMRSLLNYGKLVFVYSPRALSKEEYTTVDGTNYTLHDMISLCDVIGAYARRFGYKVTISVSKGNHLYTTEPIAVYCATISVF